MTAPTAGQYGRWWTGGGNVNVDLTATATDNWDPNPRVEFFAASLFSDGARGQYRSLGSDSTAPYAIGSWRTASIHDGEASLGIKGYDAAGNVRQDVEAGTGDAVPASRRLLVIRNVDPLAAQRFAATKQFRIGDTLDLTVDRYWGNASVRFSGPSVSGAGPRETTTLTYGSRNWSVGPVGYGWMFGIGDRVDDNGSGDKVLARADGSRYLFDSLGTGAYTGPAGVYLTLTDEPGGAYRLVDPAGTTTVFNPAGNPASVTDRAGRSRTYTYDTGGRLATVAHPGGRTMTVAYNAAGLIDSVVDSAGQTTTLAYTGKDLTGITVENGNVDHTVGFGYDADHNMTSIVDGRGQTHLLAYHQAGAQDWVHTYANPLGHTWTFNYGAPDATEQDRSTTDPLAHNATAVFNTDGAATKLVDEDGATTTLVRSAQLDVTRTTIDMPSPVADIVTEATYDSGGNRTSSTDGRGRTTTWVYDTTLSVATKQTNPAGEITKYEYSTDGKGLLVRQVPPRGNTDPATPDYSYATTHVYDTAANLASTTDPLGNKTTYSYDNPDTAGVDETALGRRHATVDPEGNKASGTPADYTTQYRYDPAGRQVSVVDQLGHKSSATYDSLGRKLTDVEARGHAAGATPADYTTTYTYNGNGQQTSRTNPLGHKSSSSYDNAGRKTGDTTPRGNAAGAPAGSFTTGYGYDNAGRMTTRTAPRANPASETAQIASFRYTDAGRTKDERDARGSGTNYAAYTTTKHYDPAGRVTKIEHPEIAGVRHTTEYTHDGAGNQLTEKNPRGYTSTTTHDDAGRQRTSTTPVGATTTYDYDLDGNKTAVIDPRWDGDSDDGDGNAKGDWATTTAYDKAGRVISTAKPGQSPTRFEYDANGRKTATIDPRWDGNANDTDGNAKADWKRTTEYERNGWTEKTTELAVRSSTDTLLYPSATNTHDPAGNTVSTTNALGEKTTFAYDRAGRLASTVDPLGNATGGVPAEHTVSYGYDADGNRTTVTDQDGKVWTYTYDARDRLTSSDDPLPPATGTTVAYSYDAAGNQRTRTHTSGGDSRTVTYTYDGRDRLVTTDHTEADGVADLSWAYDAGGNLTRVNDLAGGLATDVAYDNAGRVSQQSRGADTSQVRFGYGYDAASNLATVDHTAGAGTPAPDAADSTYGWRADSLLASRASSLPPSTTQTLGLSYDTAGNPTALTHTANGRVDEALYAFTDAASATRNTGRPSRLHLRPSATATPDITWDLGYDAAGRPTRMQSAAGHYAYSYDAAGRLTGEQWPAPGGGLDIAAYTYDDRGNLLNRTVTHQAGGGMSASALDTELNDDYLYDDANRVTKITHKDPDDPGNTLAAEETLLTRDLRGNVATIVRQEAATKVPINATALTWGPDGQLLKHQSGAAPGIYGRTITYTYDAHGHIVGKLIQVPLQTDVNLTYTWDGGRLRSITGHPDHNATFTYTPGGVPATITIPGDGTYHYHYDAHGNIERITGSSAEVVQTFRTSASGATRSAEPAAAVPENVFRAGASDGSIWDRSTGLRLADGRWTDPGLELFLDGSDAAPAVRAPSRDVWAKSFPFENRAQGFPIRAPVVPPRRDIPVLGGPIPEPPLCHTSPVRRHGGGGTGSRTRLIFGVGGYRTQMTYSLDWRLEFCDSDYGFRLSMTMDACCQGQSVIWQHAVCDFFYPCREVEGGEAVFYNAMNETQHRDIRFYGYRPWPSTIVGYFIVCWNPEDDAVSSCGNHDFYENFDRG